MIVFLAIVCLYEGNGEESHVIGIDLGILYSRVAVYLNNEVVIIPIPGKEKSAIPSNIAFTDTSPDPLVGLEAQERMKINYRNVIRYVKSIIGRAWNDKVLHKEIYYLGYEIVKKDEGFVVRVTAMNESKYYTPEELSGFVLKEIKSIAEQYLNHPVRDSVITCPAYFNDAQRQATKKAAEIAGLNVLHILNEPAAAALAYGLDMEYDRTKYVMVFDLGRHTLDVTLMSIRDHHFKTLAVSGKERVGVYEFYDVVSMHFIHMCKRKYRHGNYLKFWDAVIEATHRLTDCKETRVVVNNLTNDFNFSEPLTRDKFEKLNAELFMQVLTTIEQALKDANLSKASVDEIVMVGGTSRIPGIAKKVSDFFDGKELSEGIDPDEAVARGAAVYGWQQRLKSTGTGTGWNSNASSNSTFESLTAKIRNMKKETSLSLGIPVNGTDMSTIIVV